MQTLNPADFLDTRASPKQREATGKAIITEAEAGVAPEAVRTNIKQGEASAASSGATAARTTALTPLEVEKLREDIRKLQLENDRIEREAREGPQKNVEQQTAETRILGDMNTAVDTINLLTKQFNKNLAGQGLVKSTLEYFPTQEKGAINSTAAGLADVGLALFKIPGMGSQSDADATRFVQANQPSTADFDLTFLGKVYNLRRRVDAKARSMGLAPIKWTEPVEIAAQQYLSLPESERSKLGLREVGTFKDIPPEMDSLQTQAPTQAGAATQADASTALPSNAAFAAPIGMEAAEFGAEKTSIPIPSEMQAEMNEWFAKNPRGTVGLESYSNFRRALDAKYGFASGKPYEQDTGTVEFLKQYNDPNSPVNVALPPVNAEDERNLLERAAGTAVMSPVGTALATGASSASLNAMDALLPGMADIRAMNPNAAMVGDIGGSITGSAALAKLGTAGASKLLAQAPELAKYVTSGGKGATFLRNLLSDVTQGTAYGAAVEDDAATGAISGATGTVLGKTLGNFGDFVLRGADRAPTAQKLMDRYGIEDLTVGQQLGGAPKSIEDAATSIPIIGDIINARRGESLVDLNKAAFREVGGQPMGYGDEGMAALKAARAKKYDDAVAGKQFDLNDPLFTQDMIDALATRSRLTGEFADKFDLAVKNSIIDTPIGRSGTMSGPEYQQAQRSISGYKGETRKPGFEKDYRDALGGVSGALREMVERQDPTLVPLLREADTMYRGEKILQDAIERAKMDPTGLGADVFTPGNLTQAVSASGRKYPGTPPLKELSRVAQNVLPSKMPDSGTARRAALAGLGTVGLGGVAGGGIGYNKETGLSGEDVAYGAATTLTPLALLSLLGSRGGQRGLSKFMFDRPAVGGNIADLAEKYTPQRVLAPGLIPTLVPEAREEPVLASEVEVAAAERAAAQAAAAQAAAAQVEEAAPLKGTVTDPRTGRQMELRGDRLFYVDTGEPADIDLDPLLDRSDPARGMYRGGTVQAFNKGGNKGKTKPASYSGNVARSVLEGLTFNNAGELEAAARAYLLRQGKYRDLKTDVEKDYGGFKNKNPGTALAANLAGAIVPGVVGAFVPGGQGATLSTIGRIGRAMAEPVTVATRRLLPNAGVRLQRALPYLDEGLTGIVQSIGSANTYADAPRQIAEDAPYNIAGSLGVRGVNVGIKKGVDRVRARKKATGGLAVKKGARK